MSNQEEKYNNVSPLTVGDTIYDEGPGGVAPLSWNSSLFKDTDSGSSNLLNFDKPSGPSKQEARNYKCPSCNGEFNRWDTVYDTDDGIKKGHQMISTNRAGIDEVKACPFCQTVKGEYNNEN